MVAARSRERLTITDAFELAARSLCSNSGFHPTPTIDTGVGIRPVHAAKQRPLDDRAAPTDDHWQRSGGEGRRCRRFMTDDEGRSHLSSLVTVRCRDLSPS